MKAAHLIPEADDQRARVLLFQDQEKGITHRTPVFITGVTEVVKK